ncbi:major facilitator superfamily domain-containing protein [Microdochium trichocladiopsis]|uniref:Major facilitator superfamily domain-containing protein n=1 Tax=Microdochium trichocladiopsis TaxID=1682393 RepID=A0A9P8XS77_9PEZI|nr:major facilitator superfamily domain-containing protein [Microdochium trichocladiopsis]KAH7014555.1 major facilitator superfamily domain-containing protein [Microdochium trichocladiopsis]
MESQRKSPEKGLELQDTSASVGGGGMDQVADPAAVRSLKRKADWILLPILSFAYLCNSLDRSNISNAHTAGLEADVGLVGNQFNQLLTYYQIAFVLLGPVVSLATKLLGAKYTISGMLFVFGIASLATGWARTFQTLVVCRVFVGAFEAGFLGSVIYYLSVWYTRKELGSRLGIFYGSLVASSAFGGLLAYGMFQVKPGPGYFRWSYLFFLEGGMTTLWAVVCFFLVPSDTQSAWFLNEAEKQAAKARLQKDSVETSEGNFNLGQALSEFKTPHGWIRIVIVFVAGTVLTSNANFLAMVVTRLGLSVIQTNLYTVAPALTGAVVLIAYCKSSDHFRERGDHMAGSFVVSLVGYALLFTIDPTNTSILYFAIFLCTLGAYPSTPLGAAWLVANIPDLNARALTSGVYIAAANSAGFLSSNIYLSAEAPRYVTSLRVNITMCCLGAAATTAYGTWMRWENRRRDQKYGGGVAGDTSSGSRDPRFRFQL